MLDPLSKARRYQQETADLTTRSMIVEGKKPRIRQQKGGKVTKELDLVEDDSGVSEEVMVADMQNIRYTLEKYRQQRTADKAPTRGKK